VTDTVPYERLAGFGGTQAGVSRVFRPRSVEEVERLFGRRDPPFRTLGLHGAGRSYGDAPLNNGGAALDLSLLRSIPDWDPETGRVRVEAGVTIEDLWRATLPDGYWPPVVPGTMAVTLGGAVAANVHGKNCYAVGTIGDNVESLVVVLPTGERVECGPDRSPDLFRGVVGGFGMLGCITEITLRLKRVYSGNLKVAGIPTRSIQHTADVIEEHVADADYLVGWCDALAPERSLGRGVVHRADYLAEGEDPEGASSLRLDRQVLPTRILGLVPRTWVWAFLRLGLHRPGLRATNTLKSFSHRVGRRGTELVPHALFHFLLDYVPGWIRAYGKAGIIQVQPFLPKGVAIAAMREILQLARRRGLPPYLVVFKKHRPDSFLLSHGVDGYSLAMDFPAKRRAELWALAREIQQITIEAGGRFYFAKDSTLTPEDVRRFLPEENLRSFLELKRKCDPDAILQTDLARRVWPELCNPSP
jgi:FAD/FMN-containing dehydrogenase